MDHIQLFPGERIDQLYSQKIKIIQSSAVFSFSLDAVLLADFAQVRTSSKAQIVDLCAGNGAVGLFVSQKTHAKITEIEIQPELCDMARRSVTLNRLEEQITVCQADLSDSLQFFTKESVDNVLVNPPYFPVAATSLKNPNQHLALARHEIATNLATVVAMSSKLLKTGGTLFLVHRPERLTEILATLVHERLVPKQMQLIYPRMGQAANLVLISAKKDGRPGGLKIKSPIVTYEGDKYSPYLQRLLYAK
ncbi:tRNA (adenine37-N(6))-methyltransferase TrmN6 [Fructilactobacillus florum 8D]|uniref:tRNA (Adenine37-N(6))-methyltransferase TrmN6 n=2 Tax=Fructilactobacillus florum TaxID=640331 RepID=W9EIX2_9LACO|nr:tRNA1(Val) (adenine(37)-N6)-methyltransferase [Fructilactobacillus florum]EKK20230.1 tRNA (adenine37-N(6))-methyltransferase TrmN6 [Fructilactobacillus florum 2F]ETO40915.1 tRNA (adenine37-N(6))-methyltransferase TrmN6 [Fructilactobacillus florum 8D]KRM91382.1 hypothetical protein FC87_GL000893 [Fructilactobacillus florum DSM 22689 = JCM 16035]